MTAPAAPVLWPNTCSLVPSLMNKIPRYLNCFTWGKTYSFQSCPTWSRKSIHLLLQNMASDLEALILIVVISHWLWNGLECWRSQAKGAIRTTLSAKRREAILSPPNRSPPTTPTTHTRLHMEILSMKITTRTWWQAAALAEANPLWNGIWITVEKPNTALTLGVQRLDGLE